jgi:hypothetical protein
MKKIRQTNFYTVGLSQNVTVTAWDTEAVLWIMPKKTIYKPAQRRCSDAVTELVLRCCVYWQNQLGCRQKVLQPPSTFMILSWWCPLGHGKWHLPAIQFILAVRLIPILTHLSSRWTVPLRSQRIDSKKPIPPGWVSLAGKYHNPIPTRFLAPPPLFKNSSTVWISLSVSLLAVLPACPLNQFIFLSCLPAWSRCSTACPVCPTACPVCPTACPICPTACPVCPTCLSKWHLVLYFLNIASENQPAEIISQKIYRILM